jgi:hypothetical protein
VEIQLILIEIREIMEGSIFTDYDFTKRVERLRMYLDGEALSLLCYNT